MKKDKNTEADERQAEVINNTEPEITEEQKDDEATSTEATSEELTPEEAARREIAELKEKLEKEKKEYLFLMAEFDNFRKRTMKEKSDIIKNAGEKVFKGLLPVVDDMERGLKASENATDVASVREGLELICNKLKKYMEQNGVKEFDKDDDVFDADRHEAISAVPVPDENLKGHILDTIEKGYTINDKVLRHAKVVVGQ